MSDKPPDGNDQPPAATSGTGTGGTTAEKGPGTVTVDTKDASSSSTMTDQKDAGGSGKSDVLKTANVAGSTDISTDNNETGHSDTAKVAATPATGEKGLGKLAGTTSDSSNVSTMTVTTDRMDGFGGDVAGQKDAPKWSVPKEARDKIPKEWGDGSRAAKGGGWRWADPENPKANHVRIDPGDPNSRDSTQKADHVHIVSGGKTLGRDGKPISGSRSEDAKNAHIPLDGWNWSSWNSP